MEKHTAPPGDAWRLGAGPFIFSGVPPMCAGDLELVNDSDEKVKVRAIPVVGHRDRALERLGLSELRVGARLAPHDRTRVRAHFLLDPHTPPGTYTADLSCGGQREPVVVHVFERLGLQVEPDVIRLRGAGGDVLTTLVVVTNRGNVTETLRELALIFLEERNWVGRSLVYALRETKQDEGHQAYLDRLVHELRATLSRPARVTLRGGVSEIQPGETREVQLEITLPNELMKGRTYVGSTPFMSTELFFEVECNGANNSKKRRPR
ncbi:MAG: hypothetical protein A3G35_00670 [candidate division NC10 bacterium RIFCSPLOWO2_12_FULL_66_18]|nr:MAG: hypothetical protein A3G35_00670 [candidate division NC10 bacterium RIFCSPLOWO2_12_FULL_66_18]